MIERFHSHSENDKEKMNAIKFIRDKWSVGDKLIVWDSLWNTFEEAIIEKVNCPEDQILVRYLAKRLAYDARLRVSRYHYSLFPMAGQIVCVKHELRNRKKPF